MKDKQTRSGADDIGRKANAPELVLRDGNLRSATWRSEGEYGPLFNTRITKLYRDGNGNRGETSTLDSKDLLRVSELVRETHQQVLSRQREHVQGRKIDKDERQLPLSEDGGDDSKRREDAQRERFKQVRKPSQGTRRPKPRERTAR